MRYEFRCKHCGATNDYPFFHPIGQSIDQPCPHCGGLQVRVFSSPSFHARGTDAHFNHTLGMPIQSDRQFRSELARKNDEMSERTGFESHYVPADWRDKDAFGATDEGMEEKRHDINRELGNDPKRKIIVP